MRLAFRVGVFGRSPAVRHAGGVAGRRGASALAVSYAKAAQIASSSITAKVCASPVVKVPS